MTEEYHDGYSEINTQDNLPAPQLGGIPEPSLALERYLGERKGFVEIKDTATDQTILQGDVPNWIKRSLYGLNGKHVINSYLTEKDLFNNRIKNFCSITKEAMFSPVKSLNDKRGRMLLDLDQAWILQDQLATQARDGSHSKQRTTVTSVNMVGRLDNTPGQPRQQQNNSGGYF